MKNENLKFSSTAFISFSLAAFALVSFLYFFLSMKIHYTQADKEIIAEEGIYLNPNYSFNDPYMTKASGLKNVISGPIISNYDPYLGATDAPVRIIVFSDFTCSYCQKQEEVIKKVLDKYKGKVRFIWKDYPETNLDSISLQASLAARCAQDQGSFWEYHDKIFEIGPNLTEINLLTAARDIGLKYSRFEDCLDNREALPLIKNNIDEANILGVIGVPNIYINDKEFVGGVSEQDFSLIIDSMLKEQNE